MRQQKHLHGREDKRQKNGRAIASMRNLLWGSADRGRQCGAKKKGFEEGTTARPCLACCGVVWDTPVSSGCTHACGGAADIDLGRGVEGWERKIAAGGKEGVCVCVCVSVCEFMGGVSEVNEGVVMGPVCGCVVVEGEREREREGRKRKGRRAGRGDTERGNGRTSRT